MSASARHAVLDSIVASFLEANHDKLPSTTTVLELIEWHHAQTVDHVPATYFPPGTPMPQRCSRCGDFLSAVRVEMRLTVCSNCDRSHRRR